MAESENPHLLVFPYPAQGHMISLLDFAQTLATKGITITILTTPKSLPFLNPLLSNASSSNLPIKTLIFPFPNSPNLPTGAENTKDVTLPYRHHHNFALSALYEALLNWFKTNTSPPVAILSDFFLGWTQNLASHLKIPRIVFYSSGAFAVSVINSLWLNLPNSNQLSVSLPEIPKSPTFPYYQIPSINRRFKKSDPEWEFIRETMIANVSSWGAVFNSFHDLETCYLDHLKKEREENRRVWAVGPLLPQEIFSEKVEKVIQRGGPSSVSETEVLQWLDLQKTGSVIYICFGTQAMFQRSQMEVLAAALEISGVGFVWCVKETVVGEIPVGFEERRKGHGLVIKGWAPQVLVLKHRSVGAFLSHCGWNSVLEGLVCGVPLLVWPMGGEQFVNARLVVEELGVGIWACNGIEGLPDKEELGQAMMSILGGNGEVKKRAVEVQRLALSAVCEGGSSYQDLEGFVKEIWRLGSAKNSGGEQDSK